MYSCWILWGHVGSYWVLLVRVLLPEEENVSPSQSILLAACSLSATPLWCLTPSPALPVFAPPPPRWLILGPARSGSSFHVDPNNTSAWNAVVTGAKKWILYPPTCIPPGVHPSADGADVATPVSLTEWFLNFYQETKEGKVGGAGD